MAVQSSSSSPLLRVLLTLQLLACAVVAHPEQCPSDNSIIGYHDWDMLQVDIDLLKATSSQADATFVICPQSKFYLSQATLDGETIGNQGLRFNLQEEGIPPITIKCGQNGNATDNCHLRGGWHHVWIQQLRNTPVTFAGITFDSATRGSVWTGTGSQQVAFVNCIWKDNVYTWVPAALGANRCPTGCYGAVGGKDGSASFENCTFVDNGGDSGAVYGENMAYTFVHCNFDRNKSEKRDLGSIATPTGSAITLHNPDSNLYMSDTCFHDNESMGPATVLVEDTSILVASRSANTPYATSLRVNTNNYFDDNRVALSNQDNSYQWCHNSIYNYILDGTTATGQHDWTLDDCVQGLARCCQCEENDDNLGTPQTYSNTVTMERDSSDYLNNDPDGPDGYGSSGSTTIGTLLATTAMIIIVAMMAGN